MIVHLREARDRLGRRTTAPLVGKWVTVTPCPKIGCAVEFRAKIVDAITAHDDDYREWALELDPSISVVGEFDGVMAWVEDASYVRHPSRLSLSNGVMDVRLVGRQPDGETPILDAMRAQGLVPEFSMEGHDG